MNGVLARLRSQWLLPAELHSEGDFAFFVPAFATIGMPGECEMHAGALITI